MCVRVCVQCVCARVCNMCVCVCACVILLTYTITFGNGFHRSAASKELSFEQVGEHSNVVQLLHKESGVFLIRSIRGCKRASYGYLQPPIPQMFVLQTFWHLCQQNTSFADGRESCVFSTEQLKNTGAPLAFYHAQQV